MVSYACGMTNFSWGGTTYLSTHPRKGAYDRSKYRYLAKVQRGGPISCIGITGSYYRDTGEFIYRSRSDPETAASPKPTSARVTADKAGTLEHTAQPAGSSTVLSRNHRKACVVIQTGPRDEGLVPK